MPFILITYTQHYVSKFCKREIKKQVSTSDTSRHKMNLNDFFYKCDTARSKTLDVKLGLQINQTNHVK